MNRGVIAVLTAVSLPALGDPLDVVTARVGDKQSDCIAKVTERLKATMPNVDTGGDRGKGHVVFGTDKPYYVAVTCQGNIAFFAVSGPDAKARAEIWHKFSKNADARAAPARNPSTTKSDKR